MSVRVGGGDNTARDVRRVGESRGRRVGGEIRSTFRLDKSLQILCD